MDKTFVSIIIPVYNEEDYIGKCLDSLLKQAFKNYEIILIDDGSKDDTLKILLDYKNKYENIVILEQTHGGPGKARNWGATIAKGDILVFVDADMTFENNYIYELIKPIISGDEIGTCHGSELVGNLYNKIARAYGITRGRIYNDNEYTGVYRAILKKQFIKSGGYENDRYAFEDNFEGKIGKSRYVKNAVCYHNNPEGFKEIFNHEIWIGESLIAKGTIKEYLLKYKSWLIGFLTIGLILTYLLFINKLIILLPITMFLLILVLISIKTIQRTIKEKYYSHLIFIPIVITTRGLGYFLGILKYFFKK